MDHSTDYSDSELKKLLTSWKMEHIYEHLVEHKINLKILKILQSKHIDRLFENLPVGDQAIFEHRWDIWKRTMLLEDHTPPVKPTEIVEAISSEKLEASVKETTSSTSRNTPVEKTQLINTPFVETTPLVCKTPTNENSQMSETYVTNDSQDDIVDELLETMEPLPQTFHISSRPQRSFPPLNRSYHHTPPSLLRVSHTSSIPSSVVAHTPPPPPPPMPMDAVKITLTQPNPTHVRYSLSRILHETSGGQVILNYYEKHKILREEHRTALINVIARYIDANGCTLSLSESNNLENQIVEMFPTEREEFYRTGKRGRLYNKIANMKRVYKKFKKDTAELNQSASGPSSPASGGSVIKEEFIEELDDFMINDMRNNIQTGDEFMEFWRRSQTTRLKDIDMIDSLQDILEKWPEYKQPNAVDYITMDFVAKFPSATRFSEVFYRNLHRLEKMLFAKVSTCSVGYKHLQLYRKCSTESQHLVMLWVLHQLFPPNHQTKIDEMGIKRKKRYSIQDSQNSCICIRGSTSGIENMLRSRKTATPPMILVIGELGGDIEEITVYFEGLRYPCNSVVQAAELCCELFFLFNIDFPEESVLFYNFVQTFFLNIPPETKNSKIYTTINEINACEM